MVIAQAAAFRFDTGGAAMISTRTHHVAGLFDLRDGGADRVGQRPGLAVKTERDDSAGTSHNGVVDSGHLERVPHLGAQDFDKGKFQSKRVSRHRCSV